MPHIAEYFDCLGEEMSTIHNEEKFHLPDLQERILSSKTYHTTIFDRTTRASKTAESAPIYAVGNWSEPISDTVSSCYIVKNQ